MKDQLDLSDRRSFIKKSSFIALGASGLMTLPQANWANSLTSGDDINIIGPKEGFTPQIGTLVSMMNWMRMIVLLPVQRMSVKDLDYLHDPNANTNRSVVVTLGCYRTVLSNPYF